MIVTASQRQEVHKIADTTWWSMQCFNTSDRKTIADVTIEEFEKAYLKDAFYVNRGEIQQNVIKRLTVEIGLTFILSVIVGWIITRILDYLLSQVT